MKQEKRILQEQEQRLTTINEDTKKEIETHKQMIKQYIDYTYKTE